MSGPNQGTGARRALHMSAVLVGFFVVWQLAVIALKPPDYILPSPIGSSTR